MRSSHSRSKAAALLAPLLVASLASADPLLEGEGPLGMGTNTVLEVEEVASEEEGFLDQEGMDDLIGERTRLDFDLVRDVPAFDNFKGAFEELGGAGNCYGISTLTSRFFQKVEFTQAEGQGLASFLSGAEPGLDRFPDGILGALVLKRVAQKADQLPPLDPSEPEARRFLAAWLTESSPAKIRVGGFSNLHHFTQADQQQEWFKYMAEALQFHLQITRDLIRDVGSIAKANLGWLGLGKDSVIQDGSNIIRDKLNRGQPAVVSVHPASVSFQGHVFVVVEMIERDETIDFIAYDCNKNPEGSSSSEDGSVLTPWADSPRHRARPSVLRVRKDDGWKLEVYREVQLSRLSEDEPGERWHPDWEIMTINGTDKSSRLDKMRKILMNPEETHERNAHFAQAGEGGVGNFVKGATKFVGEFLNPF